MGVCIELVALTIIEMIWVGRGVELSTKKKKIAPNMFGAILFKFAM